MPTSPVEYHKNESYLGRTMGVGRRQPEGGDRFAGIFEPLHLLVLDDVLGRGSVCVNGEAELLGWPKELKAQYT